MTVPPLLLPRCEDVAPHLSELVDGELEGRWAARVGIHLAICPGCARLARELAATVRALHRLSPAERGRC